MESCVQVDVGPQYYEKAVRPGSRIVAVAPEGTPLFSDNGSMVVFT